MTSIARLFRRAAWLMALVLIGTPLASAAAKLTISPVNPIRLSNSTLQFSAVVNGKLAEGNVKWTSSNPAVATITGDRGTAQATLLSAGSTTISAIHGAQTATTPLTVTVAASPVFTAQPTDTNVSATINPVGAVRVQLLDNLGDPLPGQGVALRIGTNPSGNGTLTGSLKQTTDATGTATFSDMQIDWLGTGYTLVASATPSSGPVSVTSALFNELRVGDSCLGPDTPACSSGCADTDFDGLNDAWEIAGGIDLNGDGVITDSHHDLLLPEADPNVPDIYLHYDYVAAEDHDHNPPQAAVDMVVAAFAAHGVNLHVDPVHNAIPEAQAQVVTLLTNGAPTYAANAACAGPSYMTIHSLKLQYMPNNPAFHYMVFGHFATCPNDSTFCNACGVDPECGNGLPPQPGNLGTAEINGDDSIVSFGALTDAELPIPVETWAGVMMHELGHNLSLLHGGNDCKNQKPNYLSVMNYGFYLGGIGVGSKPGDSTPASCQSDADCPVAQVPDAHCSATSNTCFRIDYSSTLFETLDESGLDETIGIRLPGGVANVGDYEVTTWFPNNAAQYFGPTNGEPIDWNHDGILSTGVVLDVNGDGSPTMLTGFNDWTISNGKPANLNFQFQCTAGYEN